LVGGLAELAEEGEPARVGLDFVEQVFGDGYSEAAVLVGEGFVEPLESFIGIAAECVNVRDVVRSVCLGLRDQGVERGSGAGSLVGAGSFGAFAIQGRGGR
jgi:hypothetical protein